MPPILFNLYSEEIFAEVLKVLLSNVCNTNRDIGLDINIFKTKYIFISNLSVTQKLNLALSQPNKFNNTNTLTVR